MHSKIHKRSPSKFRKVVCVICGGIFRTNHSCGRYCSDKCRVVSARRSYIKYNRSHKDSRRRYYKEWYLRNRKKKIAQTIEYKKTPRGRLAQKRASKNQKLKNPEKYKARQEVLKALRKGTLVKKPCEVCGDVYSQAHHDDYSNPLKVRWFCQKHHDELKQKGAINVGKA